MRLIDEDQPNTVPQGPLMVKKRALKKVVEKKPTVRRRQPLTRALRLLSWMVHAQQRSVGVREIATGLNLPASTAHHMLSALVQEGMITQNDDGQYSLGLEFYRLAMRAANRWPLQTVATPHLQRLVAECNETAFLGVYDRSRGAMMFVALVQSSHPLRYAVELNQWLPLHSGATGLGILSFLPEDEAMAIVKSSRLDRFTSRTLTDPKDLIATMRKIAKNGYACTTGQRVEGAVAIAAPVWGHDGVIGDVVVTMPEQRFDSRIETKLSRLAIKCAAEITEDIGGHPRTVR
jgi:DNA-binding IclR family transcriptional regulator